MSKTKQIRPVIPVWLIWIQCAAFVVLYAFWILPEIVGFRNTALVMGALAGLYPIYQYRHAFLHKNAIPIWLIAALFAWATFHLFFLSHDFALQLLEFKRIWKYAAIGAIFALGLGISLISAANAKDFNEQKQQAPYWGLIFFALCTPVCIYLLKYGLTTYGARWGMQPPPYLQIYFSSQPYYIPKTDYVAFCLPTLAIALGQIQALLSDKNKPLRDQSFPILLYTSVIAATLFLFYIQNIKNGIAYAGLCIGLFVLLVFLQIRSGNGLKKLLVVVMIFGVLTVALYPHVQKNDAWRTLIADTKVGFQLEKYQQWRDADAEDRPNNEFGQPVSMTNYYRAAWFKAGLQLASENPLGYGLIEDSFKKMAKARWPKVNLNLSHSHSGWLDVILAIGIPGFALLLSALVLALKQSREIQNPWRAHVLWALFSLAMLWVSTEVSATITFAALIFWACWAAGLTLLASNKNSKNKSM